MPEAPPTSFADFPPLGFFFEVKIDGMDNAADASFQEVSGLEATRDVEEIVEGGMNQYKHKVPTRTTYGNLVLKRGLVVRGTDLATWCEQNLLGGLSKPIEPLDLEVSLLSTASSKPLMTWNVVRSFPVKWSVSNFKSDDNAIVVETLELAYHGFSRVQV